MSSTHLLAFTPSELAIYTLNSRASRVWRYISSFDDEEKKSFKFIEIPLHFLQIMRYTHRPCLHSHCRLALPLWIFHDINFCYSFFLLFVSTRRNRSLGQSMVRRQLNDNVYTHSQHVMQFKWTYHRNAFGVIYANVKCTFPHKQPTERDNRSHRSTLTMACMTFDDYRISTISSNSRIATSMRAAHRWAAVTMMTKNSTIKDDLMGWLDWKISQTLATWTLHCKRSAIRHRWLATF